MTDGLSLFHASLYFAKSPTCVTFMDLMRKQTSGYASGRSDLLQCPDYLNVITFIMNCTMQLLRQLSLLIYKRIKKDLLRRLYSLSFIRLPNVNVFAITVTCRLPVEAMQALEGKIRSLEQFLRARRNQRRGHYGRVMCSGEMFVYDGGLGSPLGGDAFARGEITSSMTDYLTPQPRGAEERVSLPGSSYQVSGRTMDTFSSAPTSPRILNTRL